jgi:tRNA(fMet)-specific endonuclease VapC
MIAFDADVLTEILRRDRELAQRAAQFPPQDQAVPIIVIEEIIRGLLNSIRQAEAGRGRLRVEDAYALFGDTFGAFRQITILPLTAQAEAQHQQRRSKKVRVGTHDLRIAAICVAHSATLVSRNRRDFDLIPGLRVEYWG